MVSVGSYSTKLQRYAGEPASMDPQGQARAFVELCVLEGLDDDAIVMLGREHAPIKEIYEGWVDRGVTSLLSKVRSDMAQDGSLASATAPAYLSWASLFDQEPPTDPVWCVDGYIPQGDSVALLGQAKIGKSLLSLEGAAAKAAGRCFLGREQFPGEVLYLDWENRPDIVVDRIRRMGYEAADLGRLHYETFPRFGTFDTEAGANAALQRIEDTGADLVVIDTLQRVLQGEESSSLSIREMYRYFSMELRRRGVAVLRLDHMGKNPDLGARGSSAKADDVDQVWELSRRPNKPFLLRSTHSRSRHGGVHVEFERTDEPLRHAVVASARQAEQADESAPDQRVSRNAQLTPAQLVERLDALGVPANSGRTRAAEALREVGDSWRTDYLAEAVRLRKARS